METIICPKCKCEHESYGTHEEDCGAWTCEGCGFKFVVEIDYAPSYIEWCVEHDYGPFETFAGIQSRFCLRCNYCQLKSEVVE